MAESSETTQSTATKTMAPPIAKPHQVLSGYMRLLVAADPTKLDILLLVVGIISAIASGVPFPLLGILFGQIIDDLNSVTCSSSGGQSYQSEVNSKVLLVVYLAIAQFTTMYIHLACWSLGGARLAQRLRDRYLRSLLRQDPSFFDNLPAGQVSSRLNGDIQSIRTGTSEKVGICISSTSFFVTAYVVAFIKEKALAGMLASLIPAYFLMSLVGSHYIGKYAGRVSDHVAMGAAVASEGLSNMAVVQVFSANARLEVKFAGYLKKGKREGIKKAFATGVQAGLMYFIAYAANALAFWQGSKSIAGAVRQDSEGATVGKTYTVIFILVDATLVLSQVAPFLQIFGVAASSFRKLQNDMVRPVPFDGTSETEGHFPELHGSVEFRNVSFTYPSRSDSLVLNDVSLSFPAGKHTAVVGLSGSGKSTIAGLLARLYEPAAGQILVDGHDIRHINVRHFRSFVALVQQEPAFLNRSILENIALGLVNSPSHSHLRSTLLGPELAEFAELLRSGGPNIDLSANERSPIIAEICRLVQEAASLADAASFIEGLSHGYGTIVGTSGVLLSGGQKQRIAIARALVRDSKILVLDEATASLDSRSEQRIQSATAKLDGRRTIISIAHRLSTIKNADNIIVMRGGRIIEQGNHANLMARKGEYAKMVNLQGLETPTVNDNITPVANNLIVSSVALQPALKQANESEEKQDTLGGDDCDQETSAISSERSLRSILKGISPMIRRQVFVIIVAVLGSIVVGGSFSAEAVIFGNTVASLSPCNSESSIRVSGNFFGLMFFILAIIELLANLVSWSGFGLVAEKLLYNVRVLSFRSLFEQDLRWHQSEERTPAGLLSVITKDGDALGGLSGSVLGTLFSIMINLVAAIVLTHIVAWRIALVCLTTVPLLLGTGLMELRVLAQFEERHENAYSRSVGIAVEAVNSMKTIATFSLEHEIMKNYRRALQQPRKETTKVSLHASFWLAMTYFVGNLSYALAFWWGSKQIIAGNYSQAQFLIVVMSLLVSAQLWGQMFALAPELSNARAGVSRILNVLDIGSARKFCGPDPSSTGSLDVLEKDVEALAQPTRSGSTNVGISVVFRDVNFSYPTRPNIQILSGLSLDIRPGQFCALVGPSGAGKSTIASLMERLYTPDSGCIEIDGMDITRRSGVDFRDDIALVPQSSGLFDGTVAFNVSLGARPGHDATPVEIEEACRLANIHDTIASMPQGYETPCGPNGDLLSGGQKQRLAIARAFVRKPQLLILDEATSALDAESERLLQDGLDKVAGSMTVVAIAHRLKTIKKADVVFLIEGGRCVDHGTHAELFERSESYRMNAMHQMLDTA